MEAFRGIRCSSFWDALVLRLMLEEHGVQVHVPEQGVVLSMVASGELDGIKAAVEQLGNEFPHSGSVVIEGQDRDRGAENGQATASDHLVEEARAPHRPRPRDTAWWTAEAPKPQDDAHRPDEPAEAPKPPDAPERTGDVLKPQDVTGQPDDADTDEFAAITDQLAGEARAADRAQPQTGPRRCSASTAKGRQCRLFARPGSATCVVHARQALSAARRVRPVCRPGLPCDVISPGSRAAPGIVTGGAAWTWSSTRSAGCAPWSPRRPCRSRRGSWAGRR